MVRAPGASTISSYTSSSADAVDALEQRDPGAQRLLEVELAAHRRLGDLGDLGLAAGVRGEHLDHLALDQRGVDVHDDQPHAPAQQVGRLDGDVDALPGGLGREHACAAPRGRRPRRAGRSR